MSRYKFDNVATKNRATNSLVATKSIPDSEACISQLPGFRVTTKVEKRHYTKGLTIKPPQYKHNLRFSVESNSQQLNKKIGNEFKIINVKQKDPCYKVIMPQQFYENEIKNKLKNEIYMIGVDKRNQLFAQTDKQSQSNGDQSADPENHATNPDN